MAVSVRHATLTLHKREQWYEDIRPSVGGSDFNPLAASGTRQLYKHRTCTRTKIAENLVFFRQATETEVCKAQEWEEA